jgi:hypothetical protein
MQDPRSPLTKYTLAGRMLLLGHLLLAIGGTALYICDFIPMMPAGRYPIFLFAVPVGLLCVVSFFLLARLLERIGVRIYVP